MKRHPARRIIIAGGTSWYLWNFRRKVISALVEKGLAVVAVAPEDEYSERLAAVRGVRWLDWPVAMDGARPDQELSSFLRYLQIVRQTRPDFVINHGIKANVYGGVTCRLLSVPYANSVTGLGAMLTKPEIASYLLGKLYSFACNRAAMLFVQNYDDLAALQGAGLSRDVPIIRTMGSGVDLEHFAYAPMPAGRDRTFLFIGRLQRDKGISDFVEAARAVRAECPGAQFIAVGSRSFTNRGALSDKLLEEWKREGIVEFAGQQDDVRPWLKKAHAIVLPSRREGMPRVILEAAATGRPAIAYDVPGCRDAIITDKTGFLCTPQNVAALADAMHEICRATDDELASMGRAARADAEARFSDVRLIEATVEAVQGFPGKAS